MISIEGNMHQPTLLTLSFTGEILLNLHTAHSSTLSVTGCIYSSSIYTNIESNEKCNVAIYSSVQVVSSLMFHLDLPSYHQYEFIFY